MAGKGRNVMYTAQEVPAFIQQFKEKIGYKEDPSIEDKFAAENSDDESASEPEDNKPQVVVLKKGDLTAEEAESYFAEQKKKDDDEEEADLSSGRIMFKKPTKRVSEDTDSKGNISFNSKRTKIGASVIDKNPSSSVAKKLDNAKLLSFDADDDEDD